MSDHGVVFFSFKNDLIDYSRLTWLAVSLVQKHLGLPTCVITDDRDYVHADHIVRVEPEGGTSRHFYEYNKSTPWNNKGRETAFDLSPFRYTLVLDSDYLVMSEALLPFLGQDLMISRSMCDIDKLMKTHSPMSELMGFPTYWATIMVFDKLSPLAKRFFSLMTQVRRNWMHYATLFGFDHTLYRNDYVASIALYLLHERRWSCDHDLPLTLLNLPEYVGIEGSALSALDGHLTVLRTKTSDSSICVSNQDVHAMNKRSILESLDA